jgi:hypothetical protein
MLVKQKLPFSELERAAALDEETQDEALQDAPPAPTLSPLYLGPVG